MSMKGTGAGFLVLAVALGCAAPETDLPALSGYSPQRDDASGAATPRAFRIIDDDDDGLVNRFEAMEWPALLSGFDRYDRDGSGALDRTEFERAAAESDRGRL